MKINYEDKQQTIQDLKNNIYLVAVISRRGDVAYVGAKNRVGFGSHEPLLQSMGGGSIDDYWRYTFNTSQGAVIFFTLPKYSGKQILPSNRITEEIFESAYNARRFWEQLANELSKEAEVKVSTDSDISDPDGLFAYYKAQVLKGLVKQAERLEQRNTTSTLEEVNRIKRFVRKFNQEP
jgi:hypothetical protein